MQYKVGDWVMCKVEIFADKKKKLCLFSSPQKDSTIELMSFPIVAIDKNAETYKIVIESDMSGWDISQFHIKCQNVDKKYLGKKFYDISEISVLCPSKKKES